MSVQLPTAAIGAYINQQDRYGRAPLHVAAAVNYTEMIEFLLKQKADIGITTFGELQTPIHFAAKNDACQALKLLINYGASVHIRDYQNRTPLQVAASMSRSKAARYLVELGAPTAVYDNNGEMALSLLTLKMPEVATLALDQLRSQDMINRKEYYFLNYVEGPRIFDKDPRENKARSPLEVAIQHEQYGIVMHPVMQRLINMKWENFGKKAARKDLIINIIFAFVWTILGITMPMHGDQLYSPLKKTWWRYVTALIAICLTGFEVYKQISGFVYMNKAIRRWKLFRENALQNDKRFCHPQWRDENEYLDKEIKTAREERLLTRQDSWIFLDWTALLLILSGLASHVGFLVVGSTTSRDVHVRIVGFLLMILWIRLLKFTRPFKSPGPFVASMAPMLKDFFKWSLLFCLLFIPYAAIFWMMFGPVNPQPAPSFSDIPGLLFSVFTMAAFSSLQSMDELAQIDSSMARILISSCVIISTIITLNLLIAMLADTFTRMYENSLETATMQRAKTILYLEQTLSSKNWTDYCEHIRSECSPEVTSLSEEMLMGKRDKMRLKENLHRCVNEVHAWVSHRFAQRIGNDKSDMDCLLEGVNKINDNLSLVMRQLGTGQFGASHVENLDSGVSLNIVLRQPGQRTTTMAFKNSAKTNRKLPSEADIKRKTTQSTMKDEGSKEELSEDFAVKSSYLSNHAPDAENVNNDIVQQLSNVLDLMKDAVQTGKMKLQTHEGTHANEKQDTGDHLPCVEETMEETGNEQALETEKDWTHYETEVYGSDDFQETINPGYLRNDIGSSRRTNSCNVNDTSHESSLEGIAGIAWKNGSRSQSPTFSEHANPRIDASMDERRRARNEGSSFLSTSSDGDINMNDMLHQEIEPAKRNPINFVRKRNQPKSSQYKSLKQQYSNKRFLFPRNNSTSSSNSSRTDVSSHHVSDDVINLHGRQLADVIDHESPYDDEIGSSHATDDSGQSFSDSALLTQGRVDSSSESLVVLTSWEDPIPKVPRVTWADTAQNNSGTPFLNIREISATPSDCSEKEITNGEADQRR